ncbi:MAG TPA: hypothetical protein VHT70_01910 [Candidatus Saccharimonadales bacterium]|jgi:hypothetical protein|nr:hypothetical protein [Candidatus Saccharimonadales bacterium]
MTSFNFVETPNTSSKVIDTITLTANEYLSFPTFFVEKHKLKSLGQDLFAHLYFDKQQNAIAIQFVTEKSAGLYKVNVSPQYGATCKIKSFLSNNEIDVVKYTDKYEYSKHSANEVGLEGGDVFIIELKSRIEGTASGGEM